MSLETGVFGGSFDPVHRAHVEVAHRTLEQTPCREVWFVPAFRAVHKPEGPSAPAPDRVRMLELALDGDPRLSVSPVEIAHGRPRRSVETLAELAETWPGRRWYFILGEDSFRDLEDWYRPGELARMATLVVAPRPGTGGARPTRYRGAEVLWLDGEEMDLDSTAIRAALAAGERPAGLDPRVQAHVDERGLYRGGRR